MKINKMIKTVGVLLIAVAAVSCCNPEHNGIGDETFSFADKIYSSEEGFSIEFNNDGTALFNNIDFEDSKIYKYSYDSENNELTLTDYKIFVPNEDYQSDSEEDGRYMDYDEVINYYKNEYPEILDRKIYMIEDLIDECESVIYRNSLALDIVAKKNENNEELTSNEKRFHLDWESEKEEKEKLIESCKSEKEDLQERKEAIVSYLHLLEYMFKTTTYKCSFNTEDGNALTLTEKYDPMRAAQYFSDEETNSVVIRSNKFFLRINGVSSYSGNMDNMNENGNLTIENLEDNSDKLTVKWAISTEDKSVRLDLKIINNSSEYKFAFYPSVYVFNSQNK